MKWFLTLLQKVSYLESWDLVAQIISTKLLDFLIVTTAIQKKWKVRGFLIYYVFVRLILNSVVL